MRSLRRIRIAAALAVVLLVAAIEVRASGSSTLIRSWRYPTGLAAQSRGGPSIMGPGGATRLRAILDQTGPAPYLGAVGVMSGGGLKCTILQDAPSCTTSGTVTVLATNPADDDTVTVTWSYDCVSPGDCVTLQFSSPTGPIAVRRSFWGNAIQDSIAPTAGCAEMPATSPPGIATLITLIALGGAWAMIRRQPSRA